MHLAFVWGGISHLKYVDVYVRQGKHGSAQEHDHQSGAARQARHTPEQVILGKETQTHTQDGPHNLQRRLTLQLT